MPNDSTAEDTIVRREVEPTERQANYRVLETVAEVEGVDVTALPPMYDRVDHMLDELFSEPPAPEAQVEVTFSFHGYRITADQEGTITLRKLETDAEAIE